MVPFGRYGVVEEERGVCLIHEAQLGNLGLRFKVNSILLLSVVCL